MLIKRKTCTAKENHEKTLEKHRAQICPFLTKGSNPQIYKNRVFNENEL